MSFSQSVCYIAVQKEVEYFGFIQVCEQNGFW